MSDLPPEALADLRRLAERCASDPNFPHESAAATLMQHEAAPDALTPETLAELRRLAEAATPGPWWHEWVDGDDWWAVYGQPTGDMVCPEVCTMGGADESAYIAAANPAAVLALLDELDALTARLADSDAPHPDRPDCAIVGGSGIRVTATDLETGESQSAVIDDNYALICAGNRYQSGIQYHANGTVTLTVSVRKRLAPVDAVLAAAELRAAPDEEPQP